jgi:hypothetical protein
MKTKLLLVAALVGAASLSAQAGVHFDFSLNLPLPVAIVTPAPPVPVVVAAPVYTPPPVVVVAAPPCPGPDYVWTTGYWTVSNYHRVWVPARWQYRPAHVVYSHPYYGHDHGWHR